MAGLILEAAGPGPRSPMAERFEVNSDFSISWSATGLGCRRWRADHLEWFGAALRLCNVHLVLHENRSNRIYPGEKRPGLLLRRHGSRQSQAIAVGSSGPVTVGLLGAVGEMDRAHPGPNHLNDIIEGLHTAIRLKAGKNRFNFIQTRGLGPWSRSEHILPPSWLIGWRGNNFLTTLTAHFVQPDFRQCPRLHWITNFNQPTLGWHIKR